jgi:hypothetical protein
MKQGWIYLFFLLPNFLFAQDSLTVSMQRNLEKLAQVENEKYIKAFARAQRYAEQKNVPLISYDANGNVIQLVDVDEFGAPVYRSTTNAGAATTTGVTKLRQNGGLGLNLEGEGIKIGIWDGGVVFDHAEFDSRVMFKENNTISDHGTHVAGTMMASGVNPSARGMAGKASLISFFWDNDINEMATQARADQASLIISNHSYGLIQGWNCTSPTSCTWFGTTSISTQEDWRFGFYTNSSRSLDETAFNAPFYSIFWAAGNDRDDTNISGVGGANPPDGNGGTGFDSMSQEGCAKNIFTIGAIGKIPDYTGPSSVQMSSFSNWGPTDDGRIKPDLVAAGVGIFSSVSTPTGQSGSRYSTFNGTSMAAPNAAGSLALIQELSKQLSGSFMKSATLKALAIHTAKEAGSGPGPDYMYGWGVVDAEAAARLLLSRDDQNVIVKEEKLINGQPYEVTINPQAGKKITVTIVWTDVPGTPLPASLDPTAPMLVNDLDLRVVDDANNFQFPWVLNPDLSVLSISQTATKGDNFRDNVEKIEFENPEPRPYKIRVTNKRNLVGLQQDFSIIIEYKSENSIGERFYWIGGNGVWSDPTKWSRTSGGPSANTVPTSVDRVVIDENSFSASNQSITLNSNMSCGTLTYLSKTNSILNLNGNTLEIGGDLVITNNTLTTNIGTLRFTGSIKPQNLVVLSQANLDNLSLVFDAGTPDIPNWKVTNARSLQSIDLFKGKLDLSGNSALKLGMLRSTGSTQRELNLFNTSMEIKLVDLNLQDDSFKSNAFTVMDFKDGSASATFSSTNFKGKIRVSEGKTQIDGNSTIAFIDLRAEAELAGNNRIDTLVLGAGSTLQLGAATVQEVGKTFTITSSQTQITKIQSQSAAAIVFNKRAKLCFDWLNVANVSMQGPAVVNAGKNSVVVNAANWLTEKCEDVLFPDFAFRSNCANGLTEFIDLSEGAITNRNWNFGSAGFSVFDNSTQTPKVIFADQGTRSISLTISNANSNRTYSQNIVVRGNNVSSPSIVVSGNLLASNVSSNTFQWYNGTTPITNAMGRTFPFNGNPGVYYVVLSDGDCNRISSPVVITSATPRAEEFSIYPNPTTGYVTFSVQPEYVEIFDVFGISKMAENKPAMINVSTVPDGHYVVRIKLGNGEWINKRLIKISQ